MWSVQFETFQVEKEARALISTGKIAREDQIIIRAWMDQVTMHGPESIKGDKRWNEHELNDEGAGYRSSAFSNRGRIIYKVVDKKILIKIARITPDHNYRGKK